VDSFPEDVRKFLEAPIPSVEHRIYSKPRNQVQAFADALRLRKER
jgi:hypothetical protein